MSYRNALKYGAPALGVALLLVAAAWVIGLPPVSALNERVDAANQAPQPADDQFVASPYDVVQVSGVGKATGTPDVARLSLSVSATADTVAEARTTSAQSAEDVITALTTNGVASEDIQTSHFNVHEDYEYGPEGRMFTGYTVSNGLSVTVRAIDTVGTVIDSAITAGGDNIRFGSLDFLITDTADLEREARQNAVANMKTRAEQIAEFSGRELGDLKMVSETPGGPDLFAPVLAFAESARGSADFDTPISAGENTITVSVHGVYELRR